MNPIYLFAGSVAFVLFYLWWTLAIEYKKARLDDAVAPADQELHDNPQIWTHEANNVRVNARKRAAFIRWVVVSVGLLTVSSLLAFGGASGVLAKVLPTTTPTPTPTATVTLTPSATATIRPVSTWYATATLFPVGGSATVERTPTQQVVYRNVSVQSTVIVVVTRVITVVVTRLYIPTQAPTLTATSTPTGSPTPTLTNTQTLTPIPSLTSTATETETPTLTATP